MAKKSTVVVSPQHVKNQRIKLAVRALYDVQKLRIALQLRIKRLVREKIMTKEASDEYFKLTMDHFTGAEEEMEAKVEEEIKDQPIVTQFMRRIKGVGTRIQGLLLANINPDAFDTPSRLNAYAGLGVVDRLFFKDGKGSGILLDRWSIQPRRDEATGQVIEEIHYWTRRYEWLDEDKVLSSHANNPNVVIDEALDEDEVEEAMARQGDAPEPEEDEDEEDEMEEEDDQGFGDYDEEGGKKKKPKAKKKKLVKIVGPEPVISTDLAYVKRMAQARRKGETANWNRELKVTMFKLADSFLKCGSPYATDYYNYKKRIIARTVAEGKTVWGKEKYVQVGGTRYATQENNRQPDGCHEEWIPFTHLPAAKKDDEAEKALRKTLRKRIQIRTYSPQHPEGKLHEPGTIQWPKTHPEWNLGRLHRMGCRWIAKLFLQHLWMVWRGQLGLPCRKHYVVEYQGHSERPEDDVERYMEPIKEKKSRRKAG